MSFVIDDWKVHLCWRKQSAPESCAQRHGMVLDRRTSKITVRRRMINHFVNANAVAAVHFWFVMRAIARANVNIASLARADRRSNVRPGFDRNLCSLNVALSKATFSARHDELGPRIWSGHKTTQKTQNRTWEKSTPNSFCELCDLSWQNQDRAQFSCVERCQQSHGDASELHGVIRPRTNCLRVLRLTNGHDHLAAAIDRSTSINASAAAEVHRFVLLRLIREWANAARDHFDPLLEGSLQCSSMPRIAFQECWKWR